MSKASVVILGGPDVDARLELMRRLRDSFEMSAAGSSPTLRERFSAEGFNYHSYSLSRRINPLSDLLTLGQLASTFQKLRPSIVHAFDTKPAIWGCLAARLAGVPIVLSTFTGFGSLYGSDDLGTRIVRAIYQALQKMVCDLSDLTIVQNRDDARQLVAMGIASEQKVKVILGSGVSTDIFAPTRVSEPRRAQVRGELGLRSGEIVVTMISRVIRSKGVLEFMAAAQAIGRQRPEVRFLLIGPEDEDSLDRLPAAELAQLKQTIIWPGARQDIPDVLALSDVFTLPSAYREGIPRVLLEAASMGLPLITTDSPGCNEVVKNGVNGFLVPVRSEAALIEAISRLVEQPALRRQFGQASRQRAVERFDLSVIAAQTRSVYQHLLAAKSLLSPAEA